MGISPAREVTGAVLGAGSRAGQGTPQGAGRLGAHRGCRPSERLQGDANRVCEDKRRKGRVYYPCLSYLCLYCGPGLVMKITTDLFNFNKRKLLSPACCPAATHPSSLTSSPPPRPGSLRGCALRFVLQKPSAQRPSPARLPSALHTPSPATGRRSAWTGSLRHEAHLDP